MLAETRTSLHVHMKTSSSLLGIRNLPLIWVAFPSTKLTEVFAILRCDCARNVPWCASSLSCQDFTANKADRTSKLKVKAFRELSSNPHHGFLSSWVIPWRVTTSFSSFGCTRRVWCRSVLAVATGLVCCPSITWTVSKLHRLILLQDCPLTGKLAHRQSEWVAFDYKPIALAEVPHK
jgi:hypothetical protein